MFFYGSREGGRGGRRRGFHGCELTSKEKGGCFFLFLFWAGVAGE
jgi:hypothetical protein